MREIKASIAAYLTAFGLSVSEVLTWIPDDMLSKMIQIATFIGIIVLIRLNHVTTRLREKELAEKTSSQG